MVPGDDPRDDRKATPTKYLAFQGQAASQVVVETQPLRPARRAEDAVLLER